MTKNENQKLDDHSERIARVETKLELVDKKIDKIDEKLDKAIACKADKDEVAKNDKIIADQVKALDVKFWAVLMTALAALIGMVADYINK